MFLRIEKGILPVNLSMKILPYKERHHTAQALEYTAKKLMQIYTYIYIHTYYI